MEGRQRGPALGEAGPLPAGQGLQAQRAKVLQAPRQEERQQGTLSRRGEEERHVFEIVDVQ